MGSRQLLWLQLWPQPWLRAGTTTAASPHSLCTPCHSFPTVLGPCCSQSFSCATSAAWTQPGPVTVVTTLQGWAGAKLSAPDYRGDKACWCQDNSKAGRGRDFGGEEEGQKVRQGSEAVGEEAAQREGGRDGGREAGS